MWIGTFMPLDWEQFQHDITVCHYVFHMCHVCTDVHLICMMQFHCEVWGQILLSSLTGLGESVLSCNSLIHHVYIIAGLCNLSKTFATKWNLKELNEKQTNGNTEWIQELSIFSMVSLSFFLYFMPLFNGNPFLGLNNDPNRGQRWVKNHMSSQKCNTGQCGKTIG